MHRIGRAGLVVPPLGFGAFKIGRNQGVKYPNPYDLPDTAEVERLLNSVLDLGCTLIDTAPAYGVSESRIGQAIGHRRSEFVLSTKVGETFVDGQSRYDFSATSVKASLETIAEAHKKLHRLYRRLLRIQPSVAHYLIHHKAQQLLAYILNIERKAGLLFFTFHLLHYLRA